MKKLLWVLVAAPLTIYGFEYSYSSGYFSPASVSKSEEVMRDMSDMSEHDHHAMMANKGAANIGQSQQQPDPNPPQPDDTPSHRKSPGDGCSSVDPNAKPGAEFNGVKPNTVGCGCHPKCVNGQRTEDRSKDKNDRYICKNACYPDRCFCPDPCKT